MKTILLVGLSLSVKKVIEEALDATDCGVCACGSIDEAYALANANDVLAVISSYELVGGSAESLCQGLREKSILTLPFFLYTSYLELAQPEKLAESHFTEIYLSNQLDLLVSHILKITEDKADLEKSDVTIMVVEDNEAQSQVLEYALTSQGYETVCAKSYASACELIENQSIDMIMLDVILEGGISGISFISFVRQLKSQQRNVPILVMSAYDEVSRTIEIYRMGANDYLSKPYNIEVLLARVKNLVAFKKAQDRVYEQEKNLTYIAMHDALTGLYNRRYFIDASNRVISESARHKFPLSIMVIDIDHFKQVNDEFGHLEGDEVLKGIADILQNQCRSSDICARVGGEEFVLLCPYCDEEGVVKKGEALMSDIRNQRFICGNITISIGTATMSAETASYDDFSGFFNVADEALYQAKNTGRDKLCSGT